MQVFANPASHNPEFEFFCGNRVPCFENTRRFDFVAEALRGAGLRLELPAEFPDAALLAVHSARYLDFLRSAWREWQASGNEGDAFHCVWPTHAMRRDQLPENFAARLGFFGFDTGSPLGPGCWQAARRGADCALAGAHHLIGGGASAFVLTRPPGHHAGIEHFGGYCFLNNAAIAAQALRDGGVSRVAILDVDFHHGNGTQEIFYARGDVFFASIHGDPSTEYPFYLGHADERGSGAGLGSNLNLPLPAGAPTADWVA
ncbi:acetylpolyamine amidohydrolase, partial [Candidatus Dactylopiibacterium carminicum]